MTTDTTMCPSCGGYESRCPRCDGSGEIPVSALTERERGVYEDGPRDSEDA